MVYVAAPFSHTVRTTNGFERAPMGLVHAKVVGTTTTLCGKPTLSWTKFWSLPFAKATQDRCPECVRAHCDRLNLQ